MAIVRKSVGIDAWGFEHQIPTIATLATAIGGDVTNEPCAVVASGGQQMCGTAAIDADDGVFGRQGSNIPVAVVCCFIHPPIITVKACE